MRIRRAMTLLSFVATGLLATFSLTVGGAAPASADGGNATITFVQGTYDLNPPTDAVDVYVDGTLTVASLGFGAVSSPVSLPQGSYNVAIRPAGSGPAAAPLLPVATENLTAGQNATLIFNEDNGANHVQNTFTNPTATTPAGQATVIVRNTALTAPAAPPTPPAVDAYAGSTEIASGIANPGQSAPVNLPAGNVSLSIVAPPTAASATTTLSLTAGHVYIVYAIGSQPAQDQITTAVQSYPVGQSYTGTGYVMAGSDGAAYTFGTAAYAGSLPGLGVHVNNVVGVAETADGGGYWMVASDGGIFNFGDAGFYGSAGAIHLNQPIVGMAATPDGKGYWLVASDGGIFTYGDAQFYGSTGAIHLNKPVVGMAATPDGGGYWLVASDGGIFAYGDAQFYGSTGAIHLNKPIVGIHATTDGNGYTMVASDGGIFDYGDAPYYGSLPGLGVQVGNIVGISGGTTGYSFFGSNGAVYSFGGATYAGSLPGLGVSVNNVVGGAVS